MGGGLVVVGFRRWGKGSEGDGQWGGGWGWGSDWERYGARPKVWVVTVAVAGRGIVVWVGMVWRHGCGRFGGLMRNRRVGRLEGQAARLIRYLTCPDTMGQSFHLSASNAAQQLGASCKAPVCVQRVIRSASSADCAASSSTFLRTTTPTPTTYST